MKTKIPHLILGVFATTMASQGAMVVTDIAASSDGQARDTNSDGTGDSANAGGVLTGVSTNSREGNINALWAFPLLDVVGPSSIFNAEFSVNVNLAGPNALTFNADLHVIRIAGSDAFLASDYENSDSLILADFWTPTDGLGTLTADMTSYLQGASWTSSDYLIMGVKTDPLTLSPAVNQKWLGFESLELSVTAVPEPSSTALLGLGGLVLALRRRRG